MRTIVLAAAVASISAGALAQECRSITDPAARLSCFDKQLKPAGKPGKKTGPSIDEFAGAKAALQRKLIDPESARYTDMFKVQTQYEGAVICGMVNSKNRMGGYVGARGFIFEPTITRATIMATGDSDPEYSMQAAAAYCTHCDPDPRADRSFTQFCPSMLKFRR